MVDLYLGHDGDRNSVYGPSLRTLDIAQARPEGEIVITTKDIQLGRLFRSFLSTHGTRRE
jgi:hypothetical protein